MSWLLCAWNTHIIKNPWKAILVRLALLVTDTALWALVEEGASLGNSRDLCSGFQRFYTRIWSVKDLTSGSASTKKSSWAQGLWLGSSASHCARTPGPDRWSQARTRSCTKRKWAGRESLDKISSKTWSLFLLFQLLDQLSSFIFLIISHETTSIMPTCQLWLPEEE